MWHSHMLQLHTWHSPVCTLVFARCHVQTTSANTTHLQSCSEVCAGVRMSALTHTYYLKHKWIMPEIIRVTFRECIGCVCVSGEWQRAAHTHTRTHTHAHTHTRTYTHTYTHTQHTNIHTHRWSKGDSRLWLLVTTCCSVLQCVAVCCSVSTGVTKPGLLVTILESQPIPKFTIRDSFGLTFQKNYHLSLLQRSQENQRLFNWTMCIWVCICIFIGIYVCIYIHIWIIYLCTHMHM